MPTKEQKYVEAVGRRKTSVARVRLLPASKVSVTINGKEFEKYFPTLALRKTVLAPIDLIGEKFEITAKLFGGGISSQAEALRHSIARALTESDHELRSN